MKKQLIAVSSKLIGTKQAMGDRKEQLIALSCKGKAELKTVEWLSTLNS